MVVVAAGVAVVVVVGVAVAVVVVVGVVVGVGVVRAPKVIPCATEADWHETRANFLGASELPSVCGEGFETPFQLWARKAQGLGKIEETERMRAGKFLEGGNADWFAFEHRERCRVVTPQEFYGHPTAFAVIVRHPTLPIQCTPDRILIDPEGRPGVLQLKNTDLFIARRLWVDDEPPLRVQIQVQAEMLCTGMGFGAIGALVGGNSRRDAFVEAHEEFQAQLARLAVAFVQQIESGTPPEPGAGDTRTVSQMFPQHAEGKAIELSCRGALIEYAILQREIKERTKQADAIKARIALELGDAEQGTIDWTPVVNFKTVKGGPVAATVRKDSRRFTVLAALNNLLPESSAPSEQPIFPE